MANPTDIEVRLTGDATNFSKVIQKTQADFKSAMGTLSAEAKKAKANLDGAFSTLNIKSGSQITAEAAKIKAAFETIKNSATSTSSDVARASDAMKEKLKELRREQDGLVSSSGGLGGAWKSLTGIMLGVQAALAGSAIIKASDQMAQLDSRLKLVAGSQAAANTAMADIAQIAARTQTPILEVGNSFVKFAGAIKGLGGSMKDAAVFTESVALALKVSGASSQEAASAMYQLAQAMQKGKLSGDEFVSISENGGKMMEYLAEGLGVTRGRLIEMSTAGDLTADKITAAFAKMSTKIREDAAKIPKSVAGAFVELDNAFNQWVAKSKAVAGANNVLSSSIQFIANNLGTIINLLSVAIFTVLAANITRLGVAFRFLLTVLGIGAQLNPWIRGLSLLAVGATLVSALFDKFAASTKKAGDESTTTAEKASAAASAMSALRTGLTDASKAIAVGLEAASKKAAELGTVITDRLKTITETTRAQATAQITAVEDRYRREIAIIANSRNSELANIRDLTAATINAERDKISAIETWGINAIRTATQAYKALTQLAQVQGADTKQIEAQSAQERISIYGQIEAAYRSTIDRLISEEQRLLGEVRKAEQERAALKLSTEDRIRALQQRGMSDIEAYNDRARQVEEKLAAARLANTQGNFEEAKKLAAEAANLAERNSSAVTQRVTQDGKEVTQVLISQGQAAAAAIAKIREATQVQDQALSSTVDAKKASAAALGSEAAVAQKELASLTETVKGLRTEVASAQKLSLNIDTTAATEALKQFKALKEAEALIVKVSIDADLLKAELEKVSKGQKVDVDVAARIDTFRENLKTLGQISKEAKIELPAVLQTSDALKQLDTFRTAVTGTPSVHTVNANTAAANAAINDLKQATSSVHTVYVRKVQQNALGGYIQKFADGGFARAMGMVRGAGTETSDSIPSMLSNGEYVIRASSVKKWGKNFFDSLNNGYTPQIQKFATGGLVGGGVSSKPRNDTINFNLSIGGQTFAMQGAREQAMGLAGALKTLSRGA